MSVEIRKVLQADPKVDAVLTRHFELMRSQSPEESCHVMGADQLRQEGAHLFAAWQDEDVVAVGAFKFLDNITIELKSMHVLSEKRGAGHGKLMLRHLLAEARAKGATKSYLETGSMKVFESARSLYLSLGFSLCPPFGSYKQDPLSVFMVLDL